MELETTKNINFDEFTKISRDIAVETGLSADLQISFDFINSDDTITAYVSRIYDDKGKQFMIAEAATWKSFINELHEIYDLF